MPRGDLFLARELGAAIGGRWAGRVVFAIGAIERAIENVIGRKMQQGRAKLRGRLGDVAGADAIDEHRAFGLAFRLVDLRIGGGVDDGVTAGVAQRRENGVAHAQIQHRSSERDDFHVPRRALDEGADDLTGEARDGEAQAHGKTSARSRSRGHWRSRAESVARSGATGQSTPRSGSSQASPKSCRGE